MYVRPCYRNRNGKRHAYWALVESYRTARGPRQRVVAYLGQLDQAGRLGVAHAAQDRGEPGQAPLFDQTEPEWGEVDAARIRVERCREFGAPWLGMELMRQLDLPAFFDRAMPRGREHVRWSIMAQVLVLARLCHPSSELHIAEHFYESSALPQLLGTPKGMLKEFEQELLAEEWDTIREGLEVKRCAGPIPMRRSSCAGARTGEPRRRPCTSGSRNGSRRG